MTTTALQQEWLALQAQHERYEALTLAVKLAAVAVCVVVPDSVLALGLIALLWLQEGVLKTFQGRLGDRLLVVEAGVKAGAAALPMQLHSDWLLGRPRGAGLLAQYLKSALRPTVALPYPLLMALTVAC
ncbi:hypothetical protein ACG02S_02535 [Roseateles sp. DC23W]|uniref:Uncharacterized protein n=1 Tax=Pelomonas dachongensis TaxID=3299029 RepID=A0ABW7EH25_9BURK